MRWLKEPLVHFLAIGAALFLVWALFGESGVNARSRRIVIDQGIADRLARNFALTHRRAPNTHEWKNLVDDYVTTEVLVREALKLHLDKDDVPIRRRLRQKMEFLGEDLTTISEPTDEDLRAFLQRNADYFLTDDGKGGTRLPPLDEIKPTLVREWKAEQREKANAAFVARLKRKYTVDDKLPPDWWSRGITVPAAGDSAVAPPTAGDSAVAPPTAGTPALAPPAGSSAAGDSALAPPAAGSSAATMGGAMATPADSIGSGDTP